MISLLEIPVPLFFLLWLTVVMDFPGSRSFFDLVLEGEFRVMRSSRS